MRTLFLSIALAACGGGGDGPMGPEPMFDLAASMDGSGGFFDFPYPSDLRTDARGHPVLDHFPRSEGGIVADAVAIVEDERAGFSAAGAVYFRFTAPIEIAPPAPAATMADGSPIALVDIDGASPRRGERIPVEVRFQAEESGYWSPSTLVLAAIPGVHMRPGTRYAAVLREGFATGVGRSEAFEALKSPGGTGPIAEHYAALFDDLEAAGIPRAEVVVATAFRTSDPARELDTLRRVVHAAPLPAIGEWRFQESAPGTYAYATSFETIEFLTGEPPYMASFGDGRIRFDDAGEPLEQRPRTVRVAVSIPRDMAPPPGGWPVVLYGHGTGGDHTTHLGEEREGAQLATAGIATLGFEAALHGERAPGADLEALLVSNPIAGRESFRQTVVDMMLILRMLQAHAFDIPAARAGMDHPLRTAPVLYLGHSQGAQEAGLLLGVEPTVDAAFLSAGGAGALLTVFERDFGGQPLACTIGNVLGIPRCTDVTPDHPAMRLVLQPLLDPADPINFTHRYVQEPIEGDRPTHVAMTEGLLDEETPAPSVEALAAGAGFPILEPVAQATLPFELLGRPTVAAPASANLEIPGGARITAGLMQFPTDGHFAIYDNPLATRRYVEFLRTAVDPGTPVLVAP